ncbi:MAG: alpha/beta hydrolase-fold protein [Pontixanthobacter sp.]
MQTSVGHAVLTDPDGEPIVSGSVHRIASRVYGDERILTVRLPRGYHDEPERRYPVMFSVDGGPEQDFDLLSGIAAEAEFSGSFEPFILIGIRTADRYNQLTPQWTQLPRSRLDDAFGGRIVPGGADRFRDYLALDVVPWATQRYRTDRTILTAASLGGLFVLDTFLETPEMFDDYIALTPAVWWDGGLIVDEAAGKMAAHPASGRRIYFTMGDEGVSTRPAPGLKLWSPPSRQPHPRG